MGVTAPVSVIVATYGKVAWRDLARSRALPSVHAQQVQPAQIIEHHGRGSLAKARNDAAAKATEPWLCFLDADDEMSPGFVAAMVPHLGRGASLLNPAVQEILPERTKPPRVFKPADLRRGNYLVISTLMRAELFCRAGGFDPRWRAYEDWALMWRMVDLGAKIVSVPRAVLRTHWRDDSRNNTVHDSRGLCDEMRAEHDEWKRGLA